MKQTTLQSVRSIHFVGLKGIAMTALAIWAKERGMAVSGSDVAEVFPSDPMLARAGIRVFEGFSVAHLSDQNPPDLVVYTGAHSGIDNVEVQEAIRRKIPVLPHGKALGGFMESKRQISVAGSHGKTTTSSMIATIMTDAGYDPSYAIGCGEISGLGMPGHSGNGEYFIAEADEYVTDPTHDSTPRFLWQRPEIAVVTNVDFDHPDVYTSLAAVEAAFDAFLSRQTESGVSIINADDKASRKFIRPASGKRIIQYGHSDAAEYRITHIAYSAGKTVFTLSHQGKPFGDFVLHIPGDHNVANATAAVIACRIASVPLDAIQRGLEKFGGAKRRFESLGIKNGIHFYDDYAHHPKEIQATITSARKWFGKNRIIVVFQPHTYSRTLKLMNEFAHAFTGADIVLIPEIYASARESDTFGISGATLVSEIKKFHAHVVYTKKPADVGNTLVRMCKPGDVVLFMGAGDIYSWENDVLKNF